MKRKELSVQPTAVEPYFFQHLFDTTSEGKQQVETSTTRRVHYVEGNPDGADVLWTDYVPEELKRTFASFANEEAAVATTLADRVDAMWAEVETTMARNRARREFLCAGGTLDQRLSSISDIAFWDTKERIARRFELPLVDAHLETEKNVTTTPPAADASEAPSALDNPTLQSARALRMTDEQLLDPTYRQNCLRRYFTPLLQHREELPKNMSLLLDAVQQIQTGELATLEDDLQNDAVARVPLYMPFRTIASFMQQHLTSSSSLERVEASVVQQHRALDKQEKEDEVRVGEDAALAEAGQLNEEEQTRAAEHMWVRLFEAAASRQHLYEDDSKQYREMTYVSHSTIAALKEALAQCGTDSASSLQSLTKNAITCSDMTDATAQRAAEVVQEAEMVFQRNAERLQEAIRSKLYRLEKSEAQQERLARRVREAVKELYVEQVHYEELAQEAMLEKIALKQLECSHRQLRDAVHARQQTALSTEQHATDVQGLVRDAEGCRQSLLHACAQHIERLERDHHFQRCHVVDYMTSNVQAWERKVHDIEFLYDERYCALAKKTAQSWQMEYLSSGEREKAIENLTDVRDELKKIESLWKEVCHTRDTLNLDPQELGSEDKAVNEVRRQMRLLDDSRTAQRRVVTWKDFKDATTTPARGGGRAAVARLAEQRRSSASSEPSAEVSRPLPAMLPVE